MKKIALLLILASSLISYGQAKKKQILVIGTFHFENPGHDVAQFNSFNVMTPKSQKELENISNKIKAFAPDKIFVEWPYEKQASLDKFYKRNADSLIANKADEIVQVALRSAKKLNHKKLYGIDYNETVFPYDSLVAEMKKAGQENLIKQSDDVMKEYEIAENKKIATYTLTELLLNHNLPKEDHENISWYLSIANRGGGSGNFTGAYLVSEWYRRNLYMYSLLQRLTEAKDDKVMVMLGAGHTAMLREFIKYDSTFEIVELKDILK
ncbi:DUF5694 domain-containing protein [Flavobacterium sp. DGU11]|uniref:DUF5694 domain-containing protein n=1 Tax=Flavobacterium arundinis TaxID=3139143 RepID=A0ABU9HZD8_9FLAO